MRLTRSNIVPSTFPRYFFSTIGGKQPFFQTRSCILRTIKLAAFSCHGSVPQNRRDRRLHPCFPARSLRQGREPPLANTLQIITEACVIGCKPLVWVLGISGKRCSRAGPGQSLSPRIRTTTGEPDGCGSQFRVAVQQQPYHSTEETCGKLLIVCRLYCAKVYPKSIHWSHQEGQKYVDLMNSIRPIGQCRLKSQEIRENPEADKEIV